jgi:pyrimidine-nucleoside phosphorylase
MTILDWIAHKRGGGELEENEIHSILKDFTEGHLPDYQMSSLLMAICFQGLSSRELFSWTKAMTEEGERLDLSDLPGPKIDKHSTGGVGDKTSLILCPWVASLGVWVPMMSGRSLGFTGGTVDKLEAIPGFRTDWSLHEAKEILKRVGCVMMAQSAEVAPADKKLYALRDVTGTVESIPLIASSILSKKCAEGIDGLVLDVKFGEGAFFQSKKAARHLAHALVSLAKKMKLKSVALLSSMEQPLGMAVGNALEVGEALEVLKGRGAPDLKKLTLSLAAWMLVLAGVARNSADGIRKADEALHKGLALQKFREIVEAQGGDPRIVEDPTLLPQAPKKIMILSPRSGFLKRIHTRQLGELLRLLGAGRIQLGDAIDPSVGFVFFKKLGDRILKGETLGVLHVGTSLTDETSEEKFQDLFEISARPSIVPDLLGPILR